MNQRSHSSDRRYLVIFAPKTKRLEWGERFRARRGEVRGWANTEGWGTHGIDPFRRERLRVAASHNTMLRAATGLRVKRPTDGPP
ncbi:hypothetical protein TNCT_30561 [Trichonephila clavata]|uniref:Uncharacterized protein n=1 Tax=Trichonephila clavata TaxID=2740835 RepID=A0A8X6KWW2_TRICU|nr:hypothetical protein TNCT_30561 [Trichonephila clavata]